MIASPADELVDALAELRVLFPDWRMGQLIANLATAAGDMDTSAIWDMEDDKLLAAARGSSSGIAVAVRFNPDEPRNRGSQAGAGAEGHTMNILLWALQILAALLYASSGVMKVFMFDKVSKDVPSFGALPRQVWMALGILELVCTVGLIVPGAFDWQRWLTILAAAFLAVESLVFIGVHVKYREVMPIIMSGVLGLLMAFIVFGRLILVPI